MSSQKANILHYRDNAGLECDAVIKLNNGDYALIEIKLGGDDQVDEAARHLKLLKNKIKECLLLMGNPKVLFTILMLLFMI